MKLSIVFTNDWELFGDGSGNYFQIQKKPLYDFFEVCENNDIKLTLMAEVLQQLYHHKFSVSNPDLEKVAEDWDRTIQDTIQKGHDVQLHLHPQWLGAEYKNAEWKVNIGISRIADLDKETIHQIITNGKEYLEELIRKVKHDYSCIAFRAGGYYIEPAEYIIDSMVTNGIICDVSVTKGLVNKGLYDFSNAFSNIIPWITSGKTVTTKDLNGKGIIEIPIFSEIITDSKIVWKFLPELYYRLFLNASYSKDDKSWFENRNKIKDELYPKHRRFYKTNEKKNINWLLNIIAGKNAIQLDYDYLPPEAFTKLIARIFKSKEYNKLQKQIDSLPVIATGHMKDSPDARNFERIVDRIKKEFGDQIEFITLTQAINNIKDFLNYNGNKI